MFTSEWFYKNEKSDRSWTDHAHSLLWILHSLEKEQDNSQIDSKDRENTEAKLPHIMI